MQDMDALMVKKISSPVLSRIILHRDEPIQKLREVIIETSAYHSCYKLVVLYAPAGYGKTTLLADFVRITSLPCCWYFLDETDAEESKFLQILILSILHHFPALEAALKPLLTGILADDAYYSTREPYFEDVIDALVPAIASGISERFAIFLCNYHTINHSKKINHLVNQLLRKLPPQCVLVIESRAIPDLDFAPLLAHDEIIGLDQHFLSFTTADICNLAHLQGMPPLRKEEAAQLNALFGGWVGGILLGTRLGNLRTLRTGKDMHSLVNVPNMQIDRQKLFAYLVNEVFSQNLEVYTFLKAVVILQQMTPAVCNILIESNDAEARLQYLEQQGLFVTRSDDPYQSVYTCHPILRELLCDELRNHSPQQFRALHRRAMELWSDIHDYEQAIYHALEACLYAEAAQLIQEACERFLAKGQGEMLSRWIDVLPTKTLVCYPRLYLIRANLHLALGEYTFALPLLDAATAAVAQEPARLTTDEADLFHARMLIARSKALYQMGDYTQAQKLCRQVIAQIPTDKIALCAQAHTHLGICANLLGIYSEGIAHLQKALQLWGRENNNRQTAELHTALAGTYRLLGNFALAEHHLARATSCWDHLENDWGKVDNLIHAGQIKHQQGEFSEAEAFLQEALTLARGPIHFLRGEAYTLVSLGALYQDQELYSQSLASTEEGLVLARRLKDHFLINSTLCILAMTYLFMGDDNTALLLISESEKNIAALTDRGGTYEKAKHDLALGTIYLCRGQYQDAYTYLTQAEHQIRVNYLQEDALCTTLRLTECLLRQGKRTEALSSLGNAASLIQSNDYEQLIKREFRILPELMMLVKTMPELIRFREILHLDLETAVPLPLETPKPPFAQPALAIEPIGDRKPQLKILALGEPAVLINDEPITRWRTRRAMELFFLLLSNDTPLRKEQIITALWSETTDHIDGTLHSTIYRLRKLLGEACVASRGGMYWLDLHATFTPEIWYDVTLFQEYATRAKQAIEMKEDTEAQKAFSAMVDLYRGDYLQSFYSDWCAFQRGKLQMKYLDARQHLAQIAWRQQQFDESVLQWQEVLSIDDCLEEAHYGLMRCYIRQGKRGLAWRQYQRCTERLQGELATKPGPAIQNLLRYLTQSSTDSP
jgi:ATP/maltotriose-dependent transcriptional regulator MalT/two-component SAPR family response regulator